MDCLIHLLALCVFDPSNVYVTAGIESQITNREPVRVVSCYEVAYCTRPAYKGPLGTLKLGVILPVTSQVSIDYGFAHRSYLNTNRDNGLEVAFVELTWRPFAK